MTVGELLERISSSEITGWIAFERAYGPLGTAYQSEMLALIQEELQGLKWVMGKSFGNDMPKPRHAPRPREFFLPGDEESEPMGGLDELNAFFEE